MGTKQQELVYERLKLNYSSIIDANKSMGDRVAIIVGGGTALATFFGAGEMFSSDTVPLWLLVVSAVASLVVFTSASFVWAPTDGTLPGSLSIDELWGSIIDESEEVAIANMITDAIGAIEKERLGNAFRAKAFRFSIFGVWVQVTSVFFAVWFST